MFELMVEDTFSSAHQLKGYKGACENLHGHTFKVQVFVRGEKLKPEGYVMDFHELKAKLKQIISRLDHKFLNDLPEFKDQNPTSENLARHIHEKLKDDLAGLTRVTVWESFTASASYED